MHMDVMYVGMITMMFRAQRDDDNHGDDEHDGRELGGECMGG